MSRVALLPSAYLPALGGVEELSRHLALTLRDQGDELEVWTGLDPRSGLPAVEEMDGLTVRRFELALPAANPQALARFPVKGRHALTGLQQAQELFRPEVVHVQCFGPNGVYALALAARRNLPLVVSLQGETMMDDHDIFEHSIVLRLALRAALLRADAVSACSRFTLEDAERRFGCPPGKGQVIFNGVGSLRLTPQEPPGLDGVGRYVFAVGRVVEKKGFDLLLRAFAKVASVHPDVHLVIGGAGEGQPGLAELAGRLGVAERVRLVGRLSREQVAGAMAGAQVFVMPSRLEPFGIVALEGWRAGAPLIASSRGGAPEYVVQGVDGLLVDPFDTDGLAGALGCLLDDRRFARGLGAAGRRRLDEFAWPVIAEQYRATYARAIARRRLR